MHLPIAVWEICKMLLYPVYMRELKKNPQNTDLQLNIPLKRANFVKLSLTVLRFWGKSENFRHKKDFDYLFWSF